MITYFYQCLYFLLSYLDDIKIKVIILIFFIKKEIIFNGRKKSYLHIYYLIFS